MKENKNDDKTDSNELESVAQRLFGENRKNFSNYELHQIFGRVRYGVPFVLDDAIGFMETRCEKGEKISFETLNELNRFTNIESCELKTLHDFIDKFVKGDSYDSDCITTEDGDEMDFFAYLYRYVKSNSKTLNHETQKHIKYFIDRQKNLLNTICTNKKRYHNQFCYVKHLAVGSLKFKDQMKQYDNVNKLQKDILDHIKMIVDGCNKNKCNDSALGEYLNSFCNHFDEKRVKEIFDADFMYKLRDAILGENKKISCWRQMVFLRDVYSFYHRHDASNYLFETVYKFVFDGYNPDEGKQIIDEIYKKAQNNEPWLYDYTYHDFIIKFMSGKDDAHYQGYKQNVKADSTEFTNFCNMFSLKSKKVVRLQQKQWGSWSHPEYFRCFQDKWMDAYNLIASVTLKENLLSEENSRTHIVYKVFVKTAFLVFVVVPLIILKSAFDILFLVIKSIINIACCLVLAFKRKKYGKLIKEIFLAVLSIVSSPILCPYNNFRDIKYLFGITGSSEKILTFDNWYFFNSEEKIRDMYNAKNFSISDMNLWFFIKYIFGFERIIRLDEFDNADVDLELTVERKLSESENEKENQIEDSQSIPISEYTNEYSPLRYF